jgi:hypothetical protein
MDATSLTLPSRTTGSRDDDHPGHLACPAGTRPQGAGGYGSSARLFPGLPAERADAIARHAVLRSSGRVGRSAAGRAEAAAAELPVVASVRHHDTDYDDLLNAVVSAQLRC